MPKNSYLTLLIAYNCHNLIFQFYIFVWVFGVYSNHSHSHSIDLGYRYYYLFLELTVGGSSIVQVKSLGSGIMRTLTITTLGS
jgi:hypothetical protein